MAALQAPAVLPLGAVGRRSGLGASRTTLPRTGRAATSCASSRRPGVQQQRSPSPSRPLALPAALASHHTTLEETVEGVAVLVDPADLSGDFGAHEQATEALAELQRLSDLMQSAIITGESTLEVAQWTTLKLPDEVATRFKQVHRETRKESERRQKEARAAKRAARQASAAAAAAAAAASSSAAPAEHPQAQPQPQQHDTAAVDPLEERRSRRAQQRQERDAGAALAQPAAAQPSPLPSRQPLLQQQEPAGRQRRRRSSSAAAVVPQAPAASAASPAAVPAAASQPSPVAAGALSATPAAGQTQATRSSSSSSSSTRAQASAAASLAPAAAPQHTAAASPAALPFAPLSLQPAAAAPLAASPRRATSARAGVSSRARRTSSSLGAAAAAAAPTRGAKYSENNQFGLDMRTELLTAEQEQDLAAMVQDLLHLEGLARELTGSMGRHPSDLEWMAAAGCGPAPEGGEDAYTTALHAFKQRLHHGRSAKQVMISANYKLVVALCRKYQGYGMAMGDLINEGIAGLVKGVERFDAAKGCKFSTYAHWWIRQSITRSLSEQGRLVRLPSHLQDMMAKMTRISRAYEAQYGREPTLESLARELGVDPTKIQEAYEAVFTPRSLDAPMGDAEGATLGDIVEDERLLAPDDAAYIEALKLDLESVLASLPPREAGVLRMRFGLSDGHERTLDEIGAQYNVTRERIRQIEAKAIRQLRARQLQPGSVIADYQGVDLEGAKELAARTSSGTRKQA